MIKQIVAERDYAGGGVKATFTFTPLHPNTQIELVGFDSSVATITVKTIGAVAEQTVDVPITTNTIMLDNILIKEVNVTASSSGVYSINIWQFSY